MATYISDRTPSFWRSSSLSRPVTKKDKKMWYDDFKVFQFRYDVVICS